MDIKQLTVQGTVIANAEFLVTKNNDNFMRFKIACHNKGVSNNDTDFFTVRVFDKNIIDKIKNCITKGRHVTVVGIPHDNIWRKRDGTLANDVDIKASSIFYDKFRTYNKGHKNKGSDEVSKTESE